MSHRGWPNTKIHKKSKSFNQSSVEFDRWKIILFIGIAWFAIILFWQRIQCARRVRVYVCVCSSPSLWNRSDAGMRKKKESLTIFPYKLKRETRTRAFQSKNCWMKININFVAASSRLGNFNKCFMDCTIEQKITTIFDRERVKSINFSDTIETIVFAVIVKVLGTYNVQRTCINAVIDSIGCGNIYQNHSNVLLCENPSSNHLNCAVLCATWSVQFCATSKFTTFNRLVQSNRVIYNLEIVYLTTA